MKCRRCWLATLTLVISFSTFFFFVLWPTSDKQAKICAIEEFERKRPQIENQYSKGFKEFIGPTRMPAGSPYLFRWIASNSEDELIVDVEVTFRCETKISHKVLSES